MKSYKVALSLAFMFALLFFCICSCDSSSPKCDDSIRYPYWTKWSNSELTSIVNDSLALLTIYKYKKGCTSGKDDMETTESSSAGIFLVNYKVKQKPLLWDTLDLDKKLDYSLRVYAGDFRDSLALVFDLFNNKFGFWRMGEKIIRFMEHDKSSDMIRSVNSVSDWVNGNMALQIYDNPFILNTKIGQIRALSYEEYSCSSNFLSYINGKIVCIRAEAEPPFYSLLVVDGVVADTIESLPHSRWFGNYIVQNSEGKILKIDTEKFEFDKTFNLWVDHRNDNPRFYKDIQNRNDFVSYSWWDLIEGGN